jgi:hypothetical protein
MEKKPKGAPDIGAAGNVVPIKRGKRRWSAAGEAAFLEALAETSNIAGAIRVAGLSESSVYRRRQSSPDFREKWEAALGEGYVRLEAMMLGRAINGTERTIWHLGKPVGTMREYSDRLGLALLAQHRATVRGERPPPPAGEPIEEMRARFMARLNEMGARLRAAGAAPPALPDSEPEEE